MSCTLAPAEREALTAMARATSAPAGLGQRARVLLALAEGRSYAAIAAQYGCTDSYIARWKRHYVEGGVLRWATCPAVSGGNVPRQS